MMRFKRLFDIAGEPPSNNMIEAAKRSTQKRFWTALLVSAGLLAIGCLMLDAWFTPPLALLVSILVSGAAYMAYLFVLEGMELNEASNDDVSGLLLRLNEARGAASLSVESSYIQQVLDQGRPFCKFELSSLVSAIRLRSREAHSAELRAQLASTVLPSRED